MEVVIRKYDKDKDGMITNQQYNTLDSSWGGKIAWIISMYLAALKASIEMAKVVEDNSFQNQLAFIYEKGKKNIEELFFNGEYFIHKKSKPNDLGHSFGCHIDQVYGQSWAFQLGLGRLFNAKKIRTALENLWKYNFVTDMGDFRKEFNLKHSTDKIGSHPLVPAAGRFYAMEEDKALIMTSFPYGGRGRVFWANGYYQEAMTGFEYQVASHMTWEGKKDLIEKGLAITKAIDDRYFGSPHKRNPYNDIECSDHYARAMSSYGVYIAVCGFDYNGPKKEIAFEPRLNFNDFQSSFTTEKGWGIFTQKVSKKKATYSLKMVNKNLSLKKITLAANSKFSSVDVQLNGGKLFASLVQEKNEITDKSLFSIVFTEEINIKENENLEVKAT